MENNENRYEEEVLPGVTVSSYTKRIPSEDGSHILVVEHNEHVVILPTEEEIAAQERFDKIVYLGFLGLFGAGAVAYGLIEFWDRKRAKKDNKERRESYREL